MTAEPVFYTPEAATADTVRCTRGHVMGRETAELVGREIFERYGCPYCIWTGSERRMFFSGYRAGLKASNAKQRQQEVTTP